MPFLSLIIDLEISSVIFLFKPSNQVEEKAGFYKSLSCYRLKSIGFLLIWCAFLLLVPINTILKYMLNLNSTMLKS